MKHFFLISLLFVLPSCGSFFQDLSASVSGARDMISELHSSYKELKPSIDSAVDIAKRTVESGKALADEFAATKAELKALERESFVAADKDKDGELDWLERLAYLGMLGGGAAEMARRKMKSTQVEFANLTGRIDYERAKRKNLENQVNGQAG